ncbi:MAG: hypothetical protein H0V88_04225 [Pyrinomonadaceae bacterium]|nr:hypothetical protein [Pyrinomonadaceae bacterium]
MSLYDFELAGERVRLWKRVGESYEHVLMKALCYAMFVNDFPGLEIERSVGLRYKPDLVARNENGRFIFWGECGQTSVRKIAWLLKHAGVERLVLFKIATGQGRPIALANELRDSIDERYRASGRVEIISFISDIVARTIERRIVRVPRSWYNRITV